MIDKDSPIKSYNQNLSDGGVKAHPLPKEQQYVSTLQRVVPFVSKPTEWYQDKDNWNLCIWCKENESVKTTFGLIAWCKRCYDLHSLKHDGTYITPEFKVTLAKDFDDLVKGKVKVMEIDKYDPNKIIDEGKD